MMTTAPLPPLGDEQPAGLLTCCYGTDPDLCGAPATWHIFWTLDGENGLACERHADEADQRWTRYDRHPVCGTCNLPGSEVRWSWDEPPGRCVWAVSDETFLALAAEAPPQDSDPSQPTPSYASVTETDASAPSCAQPERD